jgi:hypothetical protein
MKQPSIIEYLVVVAIIVTVVVCGMACLLADAVQAATLRPQPTMWACVQTGDVMTCRIVRPTATPYPAPKTWPNPYPAGW